MILAWVAMVVSAGVLFAVIGLFAARAERRKRVLTEYRLRESQEIFEAVADRRMTPDVGARRLELLMRMEDR